MNFSEYIPTYLILTPGAFFKESENSYYCRNYESIVSRAPNPNPITLYLYLSRLKSYIWTIIVTYISRFKIKLVLGSPNQIRKFTCCVFHFI